MIGIAAVLILLVGPLLLGLAGLIPALRPQEREVAAPSWNGKLVFVSALLYTLAFNLIFFVQELFLVLPKALLPGVRPTLFHNNHGWEGQHPLTSLFQGTGALATFLVGVVCMLLLLRRGTGRSVPARLFLIWVAYCGLFMALPQVVIGAFNPGNDVGMAMDYLQLSANAKTVAAVLALLVMPVLALWLARPLLALAGDQNAISSAGTRTRFVFQIATLPVLIGIVLILPFRIPREPIEVVLLPVLVSVIGIAWMQAGAWRMRTVQTSGSANNLRIAVPASAVLLLLLVFQWVLRPGIAFF